MAKIMLVEDDNNLREIYEARLQAEGYTIVAAKDGEEALVLAKNEKPDLVISDVMMPKISGFEMLDILRNTDGLKEVKVIMLTALGQSDDQQRADRLGADRYLVKSQVTLEDIVKVTHQLLEDEPLPDPVAALVDPAPTPAPAVIAAPAVAAVAPAPAPVAEPVVVAAPAIVPAPVVETPLPEPVAVVAVPVAEPAVMPAPVEPPTAVAAATVADPVQVAPVPLAEPSEAAAATASDSVAQSTAQEEATVEAEIADFVNGASSDPNAQPEPATPAPVSAEAAAATASDDKLMSDAVNTLIAGAEPQPQTSNPVTVATEPTPPTEQPVVSVAPEVSTSPDLEPPVQSGTGSVPIAHKKVIAPIESTEPKQDLNTLLALEEAKEAAAAPPVPPTVVVSGTPAAAAPVPEAIPAPVVLPNNPLDPNSIAL